MSITTIFPPFLAASEIYVKINKLFEKACDLIVVTLSSSLFIIIIVCIFRKVSETSIRITFSIFNRML